MIALINYCSVLGVHMTGDGHNVVMLINYTASKKMQVLPEGVDSADQSIFSAVVSLDIINMEVG
jgi:hypothetical protein